MQTSTYIFNPYVLLITLRGDDLMDKILYSNTELSDVLRCLNDLKLLSSHEFVLI